MSGHSTANSVYARIQEVDEILISLDKKPTMHIYIYVYAASKVEEEGNLQNCKMFVIYLNLN